MNRRLIGITLAALLLLIGGCSTNPATGKSTFTLLSWADEMAMGAEAAPGMLEQMGGEVPVAELDDRAQFRRNRQAYLPGRSGFEGEARASL